MVELEATGLDGLAKGNSMPNPRRPLILLTVALLACWPVACSSSSGPNLYQVRGKVLHKGTPAVGAVVFFHRKDRTNLAEPVPYGEVDSEGRFSLTTRKKDDGAPAGEYLVTIFWPDANAKP